MTARLILVGLAAAVATPAPALVAVRRARAEAEHRRLSGTWVATAGVHDGTTLTRAELARIRLTLRSPQDGPFYTFTDFRCLIDDPSAVATDFSLQPWTAPQSFEAVRQFGGRASRYPGIYERGGDTLRLCVDLRFSPDGPPMRVRPTAFAAPAGSGLTLLMLTRAK
ncbi:MAG TPA: hypothetical protein VH092_09845 [Urbifossiella sp.]|nr:hypothetical protein [Urbifossiella sp.]